MHAYYNPLERPRAEATLNSTLTSEAKKADRTEDETVIIGSEVELNHLRLLLKRGELQSLTCTFWEGTVATYDKDGRSDAWPEYMVTADQLDQLLA